MTRVPDVDSGLGRGRGAQGRSIRSRAGISARLVPIGYIIGFHGSRRSQSVGLRVVVVESSSFLQRDNDIRDMIDSVAKTVSATAPNVYP